MAENHERSLKITVGLQLGRADVRWEFGSAHESEHLRTAPPWPGILLVLELLAPGIAVKLSSDATATPAAGGGADLLNYVWCQ